MKIEFNEKHLFYSIIQAIIIVLLIHFILNLYKYTENNFLILLVFFFFVNMIIRLIIEIDRRGEDENE